MHTLHCKLLLIAGHAEVAAFLGYEALGADGLLAPLAGETGLMPAIPLVLHLPGAFRVQEQLEVLLLLYILKLPLCRPILLSCTNTSHVVMLV